MRYLSCVYASIINPFHSYGMKYHGQMALQIALLVAFTQLIPEHQVQVLGVIKARVKVCLSPEYA